MGRFPAPPVKEPFFSRKGPMAPCPGDHIPSIECMEAMARTLREHETARARIRL